MCSSTYIYVTNIFKNSCRKKEILLMNNKPKFRTRKYYFVDKIALLKRYFLKKNPRINNPAAMQVAANKAHALNISAHHRQVSHCILLLSKVKSYK